MKRVHTGILTVGVAIAGQLVLFAEPALAAANVYVATGGGQINVGGDFTQANQLTISFGTGV